MRQPRHRVADVVHRLIPRRYNLRAVAPDYPESEPGMDTPGFIAPQVHSGPQIEVWFKDLVIRELD